MYERIKKRAEIEGMTVHQLEKRQVSVSAQL